MAAKLNRKDEQQVHDFTHKAIKSALHDALFGPLTLGEKHDIRVKPKFETACWSYLPPHRIYIGMGIVGKAKETLSTAQLSGYVKSHVRHELAHAHYTERNMRTVRQALKEIDAPFQLFNLFEDARIEDRYRREAEYQFEWLVYEDLQFSTRAENLLFGLIQAEGKVAKVRTFLKNVDLGAERAKRLADDAKRPKLTGAAGVMEMVAQLAAASVMGPPVPDAIEVAQAQALLERVLPYYQRLVVAADTKATYPILTDWIAEFGKSESAPSMGCGGAGDKSDLELGGELAEDAEFRDAFEADTDEVKPDGPHTGKRKVSEPSDEVAIAKKGTVLSDTSTMPDLQRAEKLSVKFRKFFESEVRRVATATPQRKVSARHFAVGRPYYRVKQLQGKACKRIVIEVDCSGSMDGFHIEEGKVLIAALSRLARDGYVEGHVILSAGSPPRWETFKLPMADSAIARIKGFAGAEGLEYTLKDNLAVIRDADFVFVYTDAQICDKAIDKAGLHRYGVYTWGLYAGDGDCLAEMQKYFDKAILRANAEQLVDAILMQKK